MEIICLYDWFIEKDDNDYILYGKVIEHDKLGMDLPIKCVSTFEKAEIKENVLYYETKYITYKCPLKYISMNKIHEEIKSLQSLMLSDSIIDSIIELERNLYEDKKDSFTLEILNLSKIGRQELIDKKQKREQELINFLIDNKYENCLYFPVSCILEGNAISYSVLDYDRQKINIAYPSHINSLFTDTVLYSNDIDFRYHVYDDEISVFQWSKNLKHIFIKNERKSNITFNGEIIRPNEIVEFIRGKSFETKEIYEIDD